MNQSQGAIQRPGTPEKILEEFQKNAKAYKLGIIEEGREYKPLYDTMAECKDEWDFSIASMYNPSPRIDYNAYLVNLAHTLSAHLAQYAGRNVRVNLRQGKNVRKMRINVTTVH